MTIDLEMNGQAPQRRDIAGPRTLLTPVLKDPTMKTILTIAAAALLAASATAAVAKTDKAKMQGASPGASYYAPGHVKKRLGLQSARTAAPGHNKTQYLRIR
jgi:hypothetical protein